jgi:hypothetical protein
MSDALTQYMQPIVLPMPETGSEFDVSTMSAALVALNVGRMINGQAILAPTSERVQPGKVFLLQGCIGATFDTDASIVAKERVPSGHRKISPLKPVHAPRFAGGGPSWWQSRDADMFVSTNLPWIAGAGALWPSNYDEVEALDSDMLRSVLVNVSRSDRYEAPLEHNVPSVTVVDLLPRTTDVTAKLDEREVAILESKQQRDAILLSRDFRAVLQTLVDEEQFSNHDLTQIIGVTRAMLVTWRDRPLEKIRHVSQAAMGRLLFAWKYWLHVTEGELLGRYLRHVPEQCATSLLRLLADYEPTENEIARHIDRLAVYAAGDRKAAALRRRDLGGLPVSAHQRDIAFD